MYLGLHLSRTKISISTSDVQKALKLFVWQFFSCEDQFEYQHDILLLIFTLLYSLLSTPQCQIFVNLTSPSQSFKIFCLAVPLLSGSIWIPIWHTFVIFQTLVLTAVYTSVINLSPPQISRQKFFLPSPSMPMTMTTMTMVTQISRSATPCRRARSLTSTLSQRRSRAAQPSIT